MDENVLLMDEDTELTCKDGSVVPLKATCNQVFHTAFVQLLLSGFFSKYGLEVESLVSHIDGVSSDAQTSSSHSLLG